MSTNSSTAGAVAQPNPGRVLVVDDQPANLQIVGLLLGNLGHEIIPAEDGPTALKRLALRPPDLILLDLLMPGMDGCEVCTQLKANPLWQHIPVIFLSAADDKEQIVRALEAGGVDYITKPFNQLELVSRVRTQLALKAAHDQLRQLAEDKDELMGILAHDLKNYLGGIHASADLLHRQLAGLKEGRAQQLAENVLRSSTQALSFLKSFLANAAVDHEFMLTPTTVNLADAVAIARRQYEAIAQQKNITIVLEPTPAPVMAQADRSALDHVLDNLVSNAIKFSPPGKRVFLSVRSAPRQAECVVGDEGPGFSSEDKERMFRRYGRLSARPTGGEPSTGLGLSIVHKLVLGMGGELTCESVPGNGATFTLRLPKP